jgi:hypothetical protein
MPDPEDHVDGARDREAGSVYESLVDFIVDDGDDVAALENRLREIVAQAATEGTPVFDPDALWARVEAIIDVDRPDDREIDAGGSGGPG